MAYEPLHLKYRPQRFAEVVGQSAVVKTLVNAIRLSRIAPAYLFCGPRGTGKTSSARILAKSLNCEQGPTADPCGVCAQCVSITRGTSLDVIEIDAASNTGVDKIRELIERIQFAPVSSRYKIYILDEVHMLSTAAFNALLKTLEEPPERIIFVLATTDPQRVLPTIISRCQRFDYRRIGLEDLVAHLSMIAQKEGISITSEAIEAISQLSQGGLRDAESLLDQLSLIDQEITVTAVWDLVGIVPERELLALLDAIWQQDPEQVLTQIRQLLDHGKEPLMLLQNLASFYRDLLLAKTAPNRRDMVALTQPTWEALQQRSANYPTVRILSIQDYLRDIEPQLRQTPQPRLWLEICLLELLQKVNPSTPEKLEATALLASIPAKIPTKGSNGSEPIPADIPMPRSSTVLPQTPEPTQPAELPKISPPPAVQPTVTPSEVANEAHPSLSSQWSALLNQLQLSIPNRSFIRDMGQIISETEHELTLGFPNPKFADKARQILAESQSKLQQLVGRPFKLQFTTRTAASSAPKSEPISIPAPHLPDPIPTFTSPPTDHPSQIEPAASVIIPLSLPTIQDPDELEEATKLFASFFSGVIVDLGGEESLFSAQADSEEEMPF